MVALVKNSDPLNRPSSDAHFIRRTPGSKRFENQKPSLRYKRARIYSAQLGRFISRDPLGFIDGMSLYRAYFVPGGADPFGLFFFFPDEWGSPSANDPWELAKRNKGKHFMDKLNDLDRRDRGLGGTFWFWEKRILKEMSRKLEFEYERQLDIARVKKMGVVGALVSNDSPVNMNNILGLASGGRGKLGNAMTRAAGLKRPVTQSQSEPTIGGKDPFSRQPHSLQDQMTLDAAKKGKSEVIIKSLRDFNFARMEKMQLKSKSAFSEQDTVVHYVRDPATGKLMDFKFTKQCPDNNSPKN